MIVWQQLALLTLRSLSGISVVQRNSVLNAEDTSFNELWALHADNFDTALLDKHLDECQRIWCLVAEVFLWDLQHPAIPLPVDKPKRHSTLPRVTQQVAANTCPTTHIARNQFIKQVDRALGLACDIRSRLARLRTSASDSLQSLKGERSWFPMATCS